MENFKNSLIKNKKIGIVCNDAGGSEIISSWLLTKNNKVNFHLDFITKEHSLYVDEKKIIKKGKIII